MAALQLTFMNQKLRADYRTGPPGASTAKFLLTLLVCLWTSGPGGVLAACTAPCCNGASYDPTSYICCNNVLSSRTYAMYTSCCGSGIYNPNTQICCNGTANSQNNDHSLRCCGSTTYDPAYQICCNNKVFLNFSGTIHCCGSNAYDSNTQLCCNNVVNNQNPMMYPLGTMCCGNTTYGGFAANEVCCNGVVWSGLFCP
jgi:hypothetical protein